MERGSAWRRVGGKCAHMLDLINVLTRKATRLVTSDCHSSLWVAIYLLNFFICLLQDVHLEFFCLKVCTFPHRIQNMYTCAMC